MRRRIPSTCDEGEAAGLSSDGVTVLALGCRVDGLGAECLREALEPVDNVANEWPGRRRGSRFQQLRGRLAGTRNFGQAAAWADSCSLFLYSPSRALAKVRRRFRGGGS